jgi:hypothetical protein
MSSRVTRSQTRNGIPSLKKEDHNETELAERESKLSGSIAKFYTKKAQLEAREAELAAREADLVAREAELAAREKKCAHSLYLENLRHKKQSGQKMTQLELLEEGSTPHYRLSLNRTHNFVCKATCRDCFGLGICRGERGPAGYGNEEWKCSCGRWEPKTKEELEISAKGKWITYDD